MIFLPDIKSGNDLIYEFSFSMSLKVNSPAKVIKDQRLT
jgi:hypothetical protein